MPNLIKLWYRALEKKSLSKDEIEFVKNSQNLWTAKSNILVDGILYLACPSERITASQDVLKMCARKDVLDNEAGAILLSTLEFLPLNVILNNSDVNNFVFQSAISSFVPARINAMRVLRRLAKSGDQEAIQLLKESVADHHAHVREAAQRALELAGVKFET